MPLELACNVAFDRLQDDVTLEECTQLSLDRVVSFLGFCLSAACLAFRGRSYRQSFRRVLGSPVSVIVANLAMERGF